ncbi:MAG TPA: enoyl-CoA hydratase/isomerase family protein [Burkholderiales bacterium]|nr:enoyl-CoA hydratase/isomerase family protein [Burkholderiales bacterium]
MTDYVALETDARGVATLTLNRPEKHNAFDDALIAELTGKLKALDGDDAVRVVILTGAGKSFSAGADLNWMRSMAGFSEKENRDDSLALAELMAVLDGLSKPTIARVNGAVFGGGVGLVACCDIAVGAPYAKMALTEVKLGLVPAVIAPYVVRAIGPRQARRYFQTAEVMAAETAQALGLLHEVVEAEALDNRVEDIVTALLQAGPEALAAAKTLVAMTDAASAGEREALKRETAALIARLRVSAEGQEGLSAFLEKRKPRWTNGGR